MSEPNETIPQQITTTDNQVSVSTASSAQDSSTVSPNNPRAPSPQGRRQPRGKSNFFLSVSKCDLNNQLLFLLPSNTRDVHLLRCVILKTPWAAGYGKVTKVWDETAKMLSEQKTRDGSALFDEPISAKVVKECFKVLLRWIKHDVNVSTYKSGCDDENPPGEVMQLMEEAAELYMGYEEAREESSPEKASDKKRAREQAAVIRKASLAGRSYESLKDEDDSETKKSKSSKGSTFDLNGMVALATAQLQSTPKKAEYMERKLVLSKEKLKLETARFDLEAEERRLGIEERKERMKEDRRRNDQNFNMIQAQMNMQREMMEMIVKYNTKNNNA